MIVCPRNLFLRKYNKEINTVWIIIICLCVYFFLRVSLSVYFYTNMFFFLSLNFFDKPLSRYKIHEGVDLFVLEEENRKNTNLTKTYIHTHAHTKIIRKNTNK